jgi:hypothetical protein
MNIRTVKVLIRIMEQYSAKKNKAKPIDAYSTLKPETNSDSASGRSKGARFVSARILTKNIKKSGKNGTAKKTKPWKSTIDTRFIEPVQSKAATSKIPIETSYEII